MARRLIGPQRLLGLSTHTLEEVKQAGSESCDYIGLGPVFTTPVKPGRVAISPDRVSEAIALTRLPLFAIGGINPSNLPGLKAAGCQRIAVIGAIMSASDPADASLRLLRSLSTP